MRVYVDDVSYRMWSVWKVDTEDVTDLVRDQQTPREADRAQTTTQPTMREKDLA
jgi:hypothetical protein